MAQGLRGAGFGTKAAIIAACAVKMMKVICKRERPCRANTGTGFAQDALILEKHQ
jgi:hypothetical protein